MRVANWALSRASNFQAKTATDDDDDDDDDDDPSTFYAEDSRISIRGGLTPLTAFRSLSFL